MSCLELNRDGKYRKTKEAYVFLGGKIMESLFSATTENSISEKRERLYTSPLILTIGSWSLH